MKRNRITILTIAAVSALWSFSGCAQGNDRLLDKNDPVTVTIWHYYNGVQQTMFDEMVDEFNRSVGMEKGIIVEALSKNSVSELYENVIASVNDDVGAEELPDIFAAYAETAYLADKAGKLADIGQYFTEEELNEYIPGYIQEGRFAGDGSLKIFPIAKSTEIMMLNKTDWDKFAAEAGVTTDSLSTWEGLAEVSGKYYEYTDALTPDIPNDGKAFFGRDSVANYMIIGAKQLGSPFEAADENGVISASSDKAAVKRLWENFYVPYVKGYYAANSRFRSDDAKTGDIIALICSTTGAAYFPSEVTLDDDNSYPIENMVLSVPDFEGTSPFIVQQGAGMCVTGSDKKTEYACAVFLKWFTEEERNIGYAVNSGYLPVKKSANDYEKICAAAESGSISKVMQDTLNTAIDEVNSRELYTAPPFDNSDKVRDFLGDYIQDTASEDRAAAEERIAGGEDYYSVIASYTDDAAFEKWYEGFSSGFDMTAGK
ncbi:MAG: extracellular solute-binding protein [Oscillospiraceae bacterium]|nr:extracellular solute-binding protein [Oscillospiraceae bacterium]